MSLTLDPRMYMYIRANAVPNAFIALVELLHNSLDALNQTSGGGNVDITYTRTGQSLMVSDDGPGVNPDRMIECFATVGKYTAQEGSRGFFSRGASDCSALGDITFTSCHAHGSSVLTLHKNGTYIFDRLPDTADDIKQTGLTVHLKVEHSSAMRSDMEMKEIGRYFSLRHHLPDSIQVTLKLDGDVSFNVTQDNQDFIGLDNDDTLIENITLGSERAVFLKLHKMNKLQSFISDSMS